MSSLVMIGSRVEDWARLAAQGGVETAGRAGVAVSPGTLALIVGDDGPNTLLGTAGADTLRGMGGNDKLSGVGGNDSLVGGDGDDTLEGGTGNDTMYGDAGDDTLSYANASAAVAVTKPQSGTNDLLLLGIAQDGSGGTDRFFHGTADRLIGSAFNDTLTGAPVYTASWGEVFGNDWIEGGAGNDTIIGLGGDDQLYGDAGNDLIQGGASADDGNELVGGAGNDTLDGRGGVSYAVYDDAPGSVVVNLANGTAQDGQGGSDTLLEIDGVAGSAFNDTLIGSAANDVFGPLGGNDSVDGGAGVDTVYYDQFENDATSRVVVNLTTGTVGSVRYGNDTLVRIENVTGSWFNDALTGNAAANRLEGLAGNDSLDGGAGSDSLVGGSGNDVYTVDRTTDVISEDSTPSGGIDTVRSAVSWTLGAYLERLTLTGSAAINGTGNTLANLLTGNAGANSLKGGSGNDTLNGAAGNDILNGGAGKDTLTGGAGLDTFYFSSALSASSNVDHVTDFVAADDRFRLDDAVFGGIGPTGQIAAANFRIGGAAGDASDRVVYNQTTGKLYFDADGSGAGAAVLFATVSAGTAITAADIWIV